MSKQNKNIDDFIRDGFEDHGDDFDFGSWKEMEQKLENESVDSLVTEAYDLPAETVPDAVWNNVNDELDIDTVWGRIYTELNKRRKKALWWWNAASILFIAIFMLLLGKVTINPYEVNSPLYERSAKTSLVPDTLLFDENSSSLTANSTAIFAKNQRSNKDQKAKNVLSLNSSSEVVNTHLSSNQDRSQSAMSTEDKGSHQQNVIHEELSLESSSHFIMDSSPLKLKTLHFNVNPITTTLPRIENNPITNKPWTAGITGNILNTNLQDALFREASSTNTLATNEFALAYNPGVFVQYRTSRNWMWQADLYVNYTIRRSLGLYEELSFVERTTELRYQRLHIYGGKLFPLSRAADNNNYIEMAIGVFASYLTSQEDYNNNTLINKTKQIGNWDFGADLEIGMIHNFERISLAYGAQVNRGLINIMKEKNNSFWNRANTLSSGIYVRLGYRF